MTRFTILYFLVSLFLSVPFVQAKEKPLVTYKNCKIIETEWSDGDSFRVKTERGEEFTVRLYGADCIELHVSTDSDKRRLREQRRHFGITDEKGDTASSVELAVSYGKKAKEFVTQALKEPFTVYSRKHRALGDGKHERYYAFVEFENGKDLASELIRQGFARAKGKTTDGSGERSSERYKESLADLQFQAAKRAIGIWKFTNWDKLPAERDDQRKEEEEDQIATGKTLPADFRLNPNTASLEDLDRLPAIGVTLAERMIEAREEIPFAEAKDLLRVPGIKEKTLELFSMYLDFKAK